MGQRVRKINERNRAQRKGKEEKESEEEEKKMGSSVSMTIATKDAMSRKERQIRVSKNQRRST